MCIYIIVVVIFPCLPCNLPRSPALTFTSLITLTATRAALRPHRTRSPAEHAAADCISAIVRIHIYGGYGSVVWRTRTHYIEIDRYGFFFSSDIRIRDSRIKILYNTLHMRVYIRVI